MCRGPGPIDHQVSPAAEPAASERERPVPDRPEQDIAPGTVHWESRRSRGSSSEPCLRSPRRLECTNGPIRRELPSVSEVVFRSASTARCRRCAAKHSSGFRVRKRSLAFASVYSGRTHLADPGLKAFYVEAHRPERIPDRVPQVGTIRDLGSARRDVADSAPFLNPHLMERPDRGDPAIDCVGFRRAAFRGLL